MAGPSDILLAIVVTTDFASSLGSMVTGCAALIAVMVATGMILCAAVIAKTGLTNLGVPTIPSTNVPPEEGITVTCELL